MNENKEELFESIYNECVTASGASGIASTAPQHVVSVSDLKFGNVATKGGKFVKDGKEASFENDTMKVHKKSKKKNDALSGTGIVYAKDSGVKSFKETIESLDLDNLDDVIDTPAESTQGVLVTEPEEVKIMVTNPDDKVSSDVISDECSCTDKDDSCEKECIEHPCDCENDDINEFWVETFTADEPINHICTCGKNGECGCCKDESSIVHDGTEPKEHNCGNTMTVEDFFNSLMEG